MRIKNTISLIALATVALTSACNRTKQDPNVYQHTLEQGVATAMSKMTATQTAINAKDFDLAEKERKAWADSIQVAIDKVQKVGAFKQNQEFQNVTMDLLNTVKQSVANDIPTIIARKKEAEQGVKFAADKANQTSQKVKSNITTASNVYTAKMNEFADFANK